MERHLDDTWRMSAFAKVAAITTILLVGMAGAVSAQTIDGQIRQGIGTYHCSIWNGGTLRAHVTFIEYWYQQSGQWYSLSRGCDTGVSSVSCEIDSSSERSFDSRIQIGQYPISVCRAHLGAGRW